MIAVPEQLFYNTGIATYVWVITNRKASKRKGKVQLIDATSFWVPMRKSLGDKRREIPRREDPDEISSCDTRGLRRKAKIRQDLSDDHGLRVPEDHGRAARSGSISRLSPERIARLEEEKAFQNLAQSKKKGRGGRKERPRESVRKKRFVCVLRTLPDTLFKDRYEFEKMLNAASQKAGVKLGAPVKRRSFQRSPSGTRLRRFAVTRREPRARSGA